KFGAVVGDITILDNRSNFVEFTQPYAESGLTMVVRVKQEDRTWLFVLPFNTNLWIVVIFAFVYTMFVVWFLEHRSNPEFRGPWKNQLGTAMWFTFTTLFLSHREGLRSNFTRIVMFVWLFAVFVLTSSYTASLTSMLTVQRLEPKFTNIETLRRSNKKVGCDGDSFVKKYIEEVLRFHPNNIISVKSEYDYPEFFNNGTIEAAFLELPYERVFLNRNGRAGYIDSGVKHRFGGLGFAFPKGSPMARDFSRAFLKLSEDGTLNELEEYWFPSYSCSNPSSNPQCSNLDNDDRLSLKYFWTLFLVTGLTSTIMLVLYIVDLYKKFRRIPPLETTSGMDDSFWNGMKRLGMYYNEGRLDQSRKGPFSSPEGGNGEMFISSDEGYMIDDTPRLRQSTPSTDIQMHRTYSNTQTRVLRLAYTFPSRNSHVHGLSL
ncbi:Glutamate receptor, partial [Thalictrum thalictroides]